MGARGVGEGEEVGGTVEVAEGVGEVTPSGVAVVATAAGTVPVDSESEVFSSTGVEGGRVAAMAGVSAAEASLTG
jgi:hypothetical protein